VDAVAAAFAPLYGLPSWRVERGVGSFLTLDFGEPHVRIDEVILRMQERSNSNDECPSSLPAVTTVKLCPFNTERARSIWFLQTKPRRTYPPTSARTSVEGVRRASR
jgi:hypothetical protein